MTDKKYEKLHTDLGSILNRIEDHMEDVLPHEITNDVLRLGEKLVDRAERAEAERDTWKAKYYDEADKVLDDIGDYTRVREERDRMREMGRRLADYARFVVQASDDMADAQQTGNAKPHHAVQLRTKIAVMKAAIRDFDKAAEGGADGR